MRIFLDANILFSAAKSEGAVRQLLERLCAARHVLCADTYVLAEARRNLEAKGAESLGALQALSLRIEIAPFRISHLPSDVAGVLPEKDRPVLAAAIRLGCEALVTGDRMHFGRLYGTSVQGVAIHSPRTLAEAVLR